MKALGRWPALVSTFAFLFLRDEVVAVAGSWKRPSLRQASLRFPQQSVHIGHYGFDESGQDLSVQAGDDFFKFANGHYIAKMKIPEDQVSWGSFDILNFQSLERVRGILEKDVAAGGKMGMFYASYMNKTLADKLDISPIQATLAQIRKIGNNYEYATLSGRAVHGFLPSPFGVAIGPDSKDVKSYSVMVDQGGLGLPRDYYSQASFAKQKAAYAKFATRLLHMVGWPEAQRASAQIIALEEKLANVSWSQVDLRDPIRNYNPMDGVADLQARAPGFDWSTFLKEAGNLPSSSKLIVGALGGVIGIAKVLGETDIAVLKSHAAFHFVAGVAPILSERFLNASFDFSKVLTGQQKLSPRWKRGVGLLNLHMGEAVGKEFVHQYFPSSSKKQVENLAQELKRAFGNRLKNVAWMTNATKQKALNKLARFSIQVGYPKIFKNYSELRVDAKDLCGNVERAISYDWKRQLEKLGKPVDRDEWAMAPQTVNAYNMPMFNQVVFPAAILQPPFFDPTADMAVNYGGIGAVIGHEMTHGFDDQGRRFDADGQLQDWWTPADAKEFQKRSEAYGQQFATFKLGLPDGAHIKPDLTMGENIADLGGLNLALDAYMASSAAKSMPHLEGMRRVYLGWAQLWRERKRPDALRNQLVNDPHSPVEARVDIPCRNTAEWYKAFDVQPGQKLFLPMHEQAVIW